MLTPAGGLGVIRNEWDDSVAWIAELRALIADQGGQPRRDHLHNWRVALEATGRFSALQELVLPNPVRVDEEALVARVASLSYVALLADDVRGRLLDGVRALVRERGLIAADGKLDTPYRTHVVWCRRIDE